MRLDFLYNTRLKVKLFCLIFALILIDQVLKLFILNNYEINQSKQIFSIISFTFVKNYGVAFSFLNNESFNLSLWISILVLIICFVLFLYIFTFWPDLTNLFLKIFAIKGSFSPSFLRAGIPVPPAFMPMVSSLILSSHSFLTLLARLIFLQYYTGMGFINVFVL